MGRRKLEITRILDKSSRLVTFSKRRTGLFKKARQLSVLCDADVAVIVFSASDKLYKFSSGGTNSNSVDHTLSRYEAKDRTTKEDSQDLELPLQGTKLRTCNELMQTVDRIGEESNNVELSKMAQLEDELNVALMAARSRKTQLMMECVSTLQQEIASAEDVFGVGGEDLNYSDVSGSKMGSPQHLTIPLFIT